MRWTQRLVRRKPVMGSLYSAGLNTTITAIATRRSSRASWRMECQLLMACEYGGVRV